jgi:hypothetical protein
MSLLGRFDNGPQRPFGWDSQRSPDRFAYRIHSVRPDTRNLRAGLFVAALLGIAVLGFLMFNKLNLSTTAVQADVGTGLSQALSEPTPTIAIEAVPKAEAWGVVAVLEAQVYANPDGTGLPVQKLNRWTLLAFEKKSSNGWYMLFGGSGWINGSQVKVYPTDQRANEAINQARNQQQALPQVPKS